MTWVVLNLLHRVNMADFGLFYGWRSEGDKRYVSPPHISTQGLGGTDFDRRNMKSRDEQHENFVMMTLIITVVVCTISW